MKKDEARFTIRFNPADPRHRKAMEALTASGRRKASLIADAVCEYLARYEADENTVILPQAKQALSSESSKAIHISEATELSPNDDICQAVLGGLSMFMK